MFRTRVIAFSCLVLLGAYVASAGSESAPVADGRVMACVTALREVIDPRAAAALERIDGVGRQLLAVRGYIRAGTGIGDRWSWTEEQIRAFEGSADQQALLEQIDAVRSAFERRNPGYTLFVNERVRSLDEQLANWNSNDSVAAAASNLESATAAFLAASGWTVPPGERLIRALRGFLERHAPEPVPTLAPPGLSPHGKMNAVDFQVYRGETEIAGPEAAIVESVWDGHGWSGKLETAVRESGANFTGPLAKPREPWHYQYTP